MTDADGEEERETANCEISDLKEDMIQGGVGTPLSILGGDPKTNYGRKG